MQYRERAESMGQRTRSQTHRIFTNQHTVDIVLVGAQGSGSSQTQLGNRGERQCGIRFGRMDPEFFLLIEAIYWVRSYQGTRTYGQNLQGESTFTPFSNPLVTANHIGEDGATRTGKARQSNSRGTMVTPGGQGRYISGAELSGPSHAG